ncbi:MAG: HEAT repeat domain-containing protein [Deltaproteobacteria bacterium]|nr:HEAT repeat domain-containing protein [Deltaproteobacteria bacterium]
MSKDLDRVAALLKTPAIEMQIAGAIVLGELKAKGPKVVQGLMGLLDSPVPPVQRRALDALARIGPKRALPKIFPLLTAAQDEVRQAAFAAVVAVGSSVVPTIRSRRETAESDERRILDTILAELGGDDAFTTLLAGLDEADEEAAKAAALAVRHEVKRADAKQRRRYLSETQKLLKRKRAPGAHAIAAALKILGYLEDPRALPTLTAFCADSQQPANVRLEALLALRFAAPTKGTPAVVVDAVLAVTESDDPGLAEMALHTLATFEIPPKRLLRVGRLAAHPEPKRALAAIATLGRHPGADAATALVEVLVKADRRRAEAAAELLQDREEAAPALAKALFNVDDRDRAWLIRNTLRPFAKTLSPAVVTKLRRAALDKLAKEGQGFEAELDIARDAKPDPVAKDLRELATKLKRSKKPDRAALALRLLRRSNHATDADLYQLAALELGQSRLDTAPAARAADDALALLSELLVKGFDVQKALQKDRSVGPPQLYYVGFHFAEERFPVGAQLLRQVVAKGGRTKIAKMAKNKLALVGPGEAESGDG